MNETFITLRTIRGQKEFAVPLSRILERSSYLCTLCQAMETEDKKSKVMLLDDLKLDFTICSALLSANENDARLSVLAICKQTFFTDVDTFLNTLFSLDVTEWCLQPLAEEYQQFLIKQLEKEYKHVSGRSFAQVSIEAKSRLFNLLKKATLLKWSKLEEKIGIVLANYYQGKLTLEELQHVPRATLLSFYLQKRDKCFECNQPNAIRTRVAQALKYSAVQLTLQILTGTILSIWVFPAMFPKPSVK